jgi:hypothetical protein
LEARKASTTCSAFQGLIFPLLRSLGTRLVPEGIGQFIQVQIQESQQLVQAFSTHSGNELVGMVVFQHLILLGQTGQDIEVFVFCEEIKVIDPIGLLDARIDHHVTFVVNDRIKLLGGQSQEVSDLVGQGTEIPDMGHRHHQRNVAHSFTSHLFLRHFHPAPVTYDPLVPDPLVFPTMTLVILYRAEDPLAKKSIASGL